MLFLSLFLLFSHTHNTHRHTHLILYYFYITRDLIFAKIFCHYNTEKKKIVYNRLMTVLIHSPKYIKSQFFFHLFDDSTAFEQTLAM